MIDEFAVEPEVMAHWRHFQTLWGDFGIAQRRQVGLYPKQWKRQVMDRARELARARINTEMQVARMEANLSGERSKPKFRKCSCEDWDHSRLWIENSVRHTPRFPGVVASDRHADDRVVAIDEFLRDEPPFLRQPELEIERSSNAIVDMLWPLISQSREVILIDPNFDPREPRFCDVVEIIVDRLHGRGHRPRRFEIHTSKFRQQDGHAVMRVREHHYRDCLGSILYGDWKLTVCCWAENRAEDYQHPRFVLTEIGGIHIDWGLDAGEPGSKTIAKGLGEELYSKCFSRYSACGEAFRLDSENLLIDVC